MRGSRRILRARVSSRLDRSCPQGGPASNTGDLADATGAVRWQRGCRARGEHRPYPPIARGPHESSPLPHPRDSSHRRAVAPAPDAMLGRAAGHEHASAGAEARRRSDQLLERFDLVDAGRRRVANYSGGMRRRLDLAATLVTGRVVLFSDEPATGLDPRSRQHMVGRDHGAGRRWADGVPHRPIPRGGRPARCSDRGARRGAGGDGTHRTRARAAGRWSRLDLTLTEAGSTASSRTSRSRR